MGDDTNSLRAEIRNSAWQVRNYKRNKLRRAQALLRLGLAIRRAFNESDDFESLIIEFFDGLNPRDDKPF